MHSPVLRSIPGPLPLRVAGRTARFYFTPTTQPPTNKAGDGRASSGSMLQEMLARRQTGDPTKAPSNINRNTTTKARSSAATRDTTLPGRSSADPVPVPPEAPAWMPPPLPPQSGDREPQMRERGYLPYPREIFADDADVDRKLHPRVLERHTRARKPHNSTYPNGQVDLSPTTTTTTTTTTTSSSSSSPSSSSSKTTTKHPPQVLHRRWLERQAAQRRANLTQGMQGLAERRLRREQQADERRAERAKWAAAWAEAGRPGPAELMTQVTVPQALLQVRTLEDPERFKRAEQSRERTRRMFERHESRRRAAIMELYINSQKFIVSEDELRQQVADIFTANNWKEGEMGPNKWQILQGNLSDVGLSPQSPEATALNSTSSANEVIPEKESKIASRRLEQVMEALTGGPLLPK